MPPTFFGERWRERRNLDRGMKEQVERARGTETLVSETLSKIKPTEPFRLRFNQGNRTEETKPI